MTLFLGLKFIVLPVTTTKERTGFAPLVSTLQSLGCGVVISFIQAL